MTSTTVYSDVVLPAATWYEKHDLSTTDMHPFIHSFNPAIAPAVADAHGLRHLPGRCRRVQSACHHTTRAVSERHLVTSPLIHDTPSEVAQPAWSSALVRPASASRFPAARCPARVSSSATTSPSIINLSLGPGLREHASRSAASISRWRISSEFAGRVKPSDAAAGAIRR